jgi:benzoyl-CoA-dihydrodiol lyase
MLAASSHAHKVNFCKFTNETRCWMEGGSLRFLAALNGTASGGGYEIALACDHILLIDDRTAAVSLPEVPLLGVLPGTGGLTRVTDKRKVRRDRADWFATRAEGMRGRDALAWGLIDELAPRSRWDDAVRARALALAATARTPAPGPGLPLGPVEPYRHLRVDVDRARRAAHVTLAGPTDSPAAVDADAWVLRAARELDHALCHLRLNEAEVATLVLRTTGERAAVLAWDDYLAANGEDWRVVETVGQWRRTLQRLDLTARTIVAVVEPGSCFAGTLAELLLAADRSFMLDGVFQDDDDPLPPATVTLSAANLGWYPGFNDLSRLAARLLAEPEQVAALAGRVGEPLDAAACAEAGLVTFTPDDLDWDDEVRLAIEERAAYSPDALTGLEANLRFPGPETMATKIFGRLTAWQNWIFQRPNAAGPEGALKRYGTGTRPSFDPNRT